MRRRDRRQRVFRGRVARIAIVSAMGVLAAAFFRAQILATDDWLLQSQSNRLRTFTVPPPRGIIRDRAGRALADNIPGHSVSILPAAPDSMIATLVRLGEHLDFGDEHAETLFARARARPLRPLLVAADVSFDAVAAIEERKSAFPGVLLESRPKRRYPAGPVGAHVVGYVGEINEAELALPRFASAEPGAIVGRAGVEAHYEQRLRGRPGTRYVEVDVLGRIVGVFEGAAEIAAQPGGDVDLHVDLDLMEWIDHIFPKELNGAVVALEVETGGVLAMYSKPAFDPNVFAGIVEPEEWARLSQDPQSPLYNRAAVGKYPPGSPWKLVGAALGLEAGLIEPSTRFPQSCNGTFRFGNRTVRCWKPEGHGSLDLVGAVQHSCNVYFYQLGLALGLERVLEGGNRMGFGRGTGIDLPQEAEGTFPEGVAFWDRQFGYRAGEGEVLNLILGQGPNAQSPLKMAQFMLAVARDGSAPPPTLNRAAATPESWRLDVSLESLDAIREGLRRVTAPGGTAHLSSLEHFDLLGKTGTAETGGGQPNHAWFAGMAGPRGAPPEVVVVALVEFGDSGSETAAPLVAKAADYYLRGRHGIARDTVQTLREHLLTGRPAAWARDRGNF